MQRHLTAFEADLVEATGTRLLSLVATACGLTQTGADATAHATLGVLGTSGGLDGIELHLVFLVDAVLTAPAPGRRSC